MALTRKFLSALGIESDKIDEIITAHTETVDGLKEQRDQFKADAEKLPDVQKELETTKTELDSLKESAEKNGNNPYKEEYDKLKAEFDKYKEDQSAKEVLANKTSAYKALLKEAGISEKRIDSIIKVSADAIDKLELKDDGSVKDSENIVKGIGEEWADFKVQEGKVGANTSVPPANNGGEPRAKSRAAQLASEYHANLYGSNNSKED